MNSTDWFDAFLGQDEEPGTLAQGFEHAAMVCAEPRARRRASTGMLPNMVASRGLSGGRPSSASGGTERVYQRMGYFSEVSVDIASPRTPSTPSTVARDGEVIGASVEESSLDDSDNGGSVSSPRSSIDASMPPPRIQPPPPPAHRPQRLPKRTNAMIAATKCN